MLTCIYLHALKDRTRVCSQSKRVRKPLAERNNKTNAAARSSAVSRHNTLQQPRAWSRNSGAFLFLLFVLSLLVVASTAKSLSGGPNGAPPSPSLRRRVVDKLCRAREKMDDAVGLHLSSSTSSSASSRSLSHSDASGGEYHHGNHVKIKSKKYSSRGSKKSKQMWQSCVISNRYFSV